MNTLFRRWILAPVIWLAVCAAAVSVASLGVFSTARYTSPVEIQNSSVALVVAQTLFLIFLWPLFEFNAPPRTCNPAGLGEAVLRLLGLILLGVPFFLLTLRTAEMAGGAILRGQLFLFVLGIAVAAFVRLSGAAMWYYPAAFFVSAALPFVAYLLREEGDIAASWAASVSPPWAAGRIVSGTADWTPLILITILAATGVATLFVGSRRHTNHD